MDKIINVKEIIEKENVKLKVKINDLKEKGVTPSFAVVIANNIPSTEVYVRNKVRLAESLGVKVNVIKVEESVTEEELLNKINTLNLDKNVHGIIVQVPLYAHLDSKKINESILPSKDIDGFSVENMGKILLGDTNVFPCTPAGILKILDAENISLEGKKVVILGRSNIVGKPLALMCMARNATVTVCHSKTKNLAAETSAADVLIVAIGKANFVTKEMVKKDAVVIDVGINRVENGSLCGDVNLEDCIEKVSKITKVPGGVGIATVHMVISNLCTLIQNKLEK